MNTIKNNIQKAFFALTLVLALNSNAQSVAINTDGSTADPSAILDLKSTNQGVLVPRLTQAQRTIITAPATGLMVYQTDATAGFYFYSGTAWTSLSATGATGAQGPQGIQGEVGSQGPIGLTGATGPQGLTGATGANGATGPQGIQGEVGPQGPQGIAGTNGNDGPAGPQGIQGPIGLTGATGAVGATGATGPQGIQGLTGAQGIQGEVGPQGLTGATGPQGIAGTNGNDGAVGATGPQGIQGEVGSQGPIGLTGATGPQGIAGTNGTNGQGVPTGGTANQVLAKVDGTNYNTTWVTPASGSADNLGNHTATQALNMSNNNITNANNTTTNRVTFQEMVNPTILNYSSTLTTVSSAQLDATGYSYIKISGVALGTPATITGLAGGVQGKIVNLMIDSPYTLTFNSPSEQVGSKLFNTWSSTNAGQNLPYNGTRYIVTLMFDNNIWQVINYML